MMALILILPKEEQAFGRQVERIPLAEQLMNEGVAEEYSPVNEVGLVVVDKVADPIPIDEPKNEEAKADVEPIQLPIIEVIEEAKLDPSVLGEPLQVEVLEVEKPVEPLLKATKSVKKKLQADTEAIAPLPRISRKREASSEIHKEAWLLAQGKEKFSLQIMGGSDGASIANYIKKQKEKGQFAYYRAVKKGKDWYPLLYGLYPSREAAKQAVKELPREYQKLKPWARSLEAVQSEIRAAAEN
jgi:DamX protein